MSKISDQSQLAALETCLRMIRFNERPNARERELLCSHIEAIRDRIVTARALKAQREAAKFDGVA